MIWLVLAIISFVGWLFVGIGTLMSEKITKLDYFLVWSLYLLYRLAVVIEELLETILQSL